MNQWQAKFHIALSLLATWIIEKHRFTLHLMNQWQAKFHIALSLLATWIIEKHRFTLHLMNQWQAKFHIALSLLATWIIEKHRFTLHLMNQWQAMIHLHLAVGPGEPMASSARVSDYTPPLPPLIPHFKKSLASNPIWWEVRININHWFFGLAYNPVFRWGTTWNLRQVDGIVLTVWSQWVFSQGNIWLVELSSLFGA